MITENLIISKLWQFHPRATSFTLLSKDPPDLQRRVCRWWWAVSSLERAWECSGRWLARERRCRRGCFWLYHSGSSTFSSSWTLNEEEKMLEPHAIHFCESLYIKHEYTVTYNSAAQYILNILWSFKKKKKSHYELNKWIKGQKWMQFDQSKCRALWFFIQSN